MLPQPPRHLRIVAHAEPISLIVMLANIFTIHLKPISSAMGPTHGCAYLFVVIATWRFQNTPARPRSWPWFPAPTGSSLCDNFTAVLPPAPGRKAPCPHEPCVSDTHRRHLLPADVLDQRTTPSPLQRDHGGRSLSRLSERRRIRPVGAPIRRTHGIRRVPRPELLDLYRHRLAPPHHMGHSPPPQANPSCSSPTTHPWVAPSVIRSSPCGTSAEDLP